MINLDPYISQAQIGFALIVIAFVVVWRFFVVFPPRQASGKSK